MTEAVQAEMETSSRQPARIARLAWLATFVVPLLLAALLLAVKTANAGPALPPAVPLAFAEDLGAEEEAEEAKFEECIRAEEELEAGEIGESEVEATCEEGEEAPVGPSAAGRSANEQCPLRSTRAHATLRRNRLKVTVGYTTNRAVKAKIELYKGSNRIAKLTRQLGRSGVLRFARTVGPKQAKKRTVVRIKLPTGRAGCPSRRLVLFPK